MSHGLPREDDELPQDFETLNLDGGEPLPELPQDFETLNLDE
jgi:hypothetical protein